MKRNTHWIRGKKERKEGRMKETEGSSERVVGRERCRRLRSRKIEEYYG